MKRREPTMTIRVRVPASTSNLGPGFDALGMALSLHNEIELDWRAESGPSVIRIEGEGAETLPRDATNEVAKILGSGLGLLASWSIRLKNRIPVARGLGSSAATRVGALLAARAMRDEPHRLQDDELLDFACEAEGHPDNAVPAMYGGLHLSLRDGGRLVHVALKPPRGVAAVVCIPDFELSTAKARAALPPRYPRADAVFTSARVGLLVYAFERQRFDLLRIAMQDVLHQPHRAPLIPGLQSVIKSALAAGAHGAALSGAGPTVFALAPKARGPVVGRAMQKTWLARRVESRVLVLDIDRKGAVVERVR